MSYESKPLIRMTMDDGQEITLLHSETPRTDRDPSDIVWEFVAIMREIQQQGPLDDPDVIFIDKDGTRYY